MVTKKLNPIKLATFTMIKSQLKSKKNKKHRLYAGNAKYKIQILHWKIYASV